LNDTGNATVFTIQNGARKADLGADPSCSGRQGFALNVTATRAVATPSEWFQRNTCGVVAEALPIADPCGFKMDAAAVSRAEAAVTANYCNSLNKTIQTTVAVCQPTSTSANTGSQRASSALGTVSMISTFSIAILGTGALLLW